MEITTIDVAYTVGGATLGVSNSEQLMTRTQLVMTNRTIVAISH